jgi:hypothetical protein
MVAIIPVFPLGAVLSVMPVALLQKAGWIHGFPARAVAASIAGLCVFFFFRLSSLEGRSLGRRILLALFPIFGTWLWCNLGFGGAWQIALGFALLGEVGALYFTLFRPRPLVAGAFFALAFGNRTELILTLPVYLYLLSPAPAGENSPLVAKTKKWLRESWRPLTDFLVLPLTLGALTAAYNFARFDSFFDFGYARIPSVLRGINMDCFRFTPFHGTSTKCCSKASRTARHFSLHQDLSIWLLDLPEQSISLSSL